MASQKGGKKKGKTEERDPLLNLIPPWPEWNDAELNAEKWDADSSGGKSKDKSKVAPETSSKGYEDPLGHGELPGGLFEVSWVRPNTLNPDVQFIVVEEGLTSCTDLVTPNIHLLNSEFMRNIIASVANLLRISHRKPFDIELQSPTFIPTGGKIWQPWHHVYSLCKAGKDQTHLPVYNPGGKYIVRLFYLGKWRKITVDDYLPIDKNGRLLLPTTVEGNTLWFTILSKALLRIGSLTWTDEKELVDFNVTCCLTGWLSLRVNTQGISAKYGWYMCQKLLMANDEDASRRYEGVTQEAKEKYASTAQEKDTDQLYEQSSESEHEIIGPVVIYAKIEDLKDSPHAIKGISPCVEHVVMITETSNLKDGDPNRPPTPLWKKFRWKAWAAKKGLIEYEPNAEILNVRVFSCMKTVVRPQSEQNVAIDSKFDILQILPLLVEKESQTDPPADSKSGKSSKDNKSAGSQKAEKKSKVSGDKSSKGSKASSNKPRPILVNIEEETLEELNLTEPWFHLEKLISFISSFEVYYRSSNFTNNFKISDISELTPVEITVSTKKEKATKDKSKKDKTIKEDNNFGVKERICRKNLFYFFVDSIYTKKIFISFSVLPQSVEDKYLSKIRPKEPDTEVENKGGFLSYHVLGVKYDWKEEDTQTNVFTISTTGTGTTMLQLQEGITTMGIWLNVPKYYCLHIMSQVPFVVSTLKEIQSNMVNCSSSLRYYGDRIMNAYRTLVEDMGDFQEMFEKFHLSYRPRFLPSSLLKERSKLSEEINDRFDEATLITLKESISDYEALEEAVTEFARFSRRTSFGIEIVNKRSSVLDLQSLHQSKIWLTHTATQTEDTSDAKKKDTTPTSKKGKQSETPEPQLIINKPTSIIAKDPDFFIKVLLNMLYLDYDLIKCYPFRSDLGIRLSYDDYVGTRQITPNQDWLPLIRFVVNFHSLEQTLCAFNFSASTPNYTFRVFNNDTLQEMPPSLLDTCPAHYFTNERGYTLLGYCFPDLVKQQQVSWSLRILAENYGNILHSCTDYIDSDSRPCTKLQPPNLMVLELTDNYVPNKENVICLCLLKSKVKQFITLRLLLSNCNVPCLLQIKDNSLDITEIEKCGTGGVIIPILELDANYKEGEFVEYQVQAVVYNKDDWPISSEERMLISKIKERRSNELFVFKPASSSMLKTSNLSLGPSAPSWTLQLLINANNSESTSLELDRTREESIRNLKANWEKNDPGRYARATQIRNNFIKSLMEESEARIHVEHVAKEEEKIKQVKSSNRRSSMLSHFRSKIPSSEEIAFSTLLESCPRKRESEVFDDDKKFYAKYISANYENELMRIEQAKRTEFLYKTFDQDRTSSKQLIENCFEMRDKYIKQSMEFSDDKQSNVKKEKKKKK